MSDKKLNVTKHAALKYKYNNKKILETLTILIIMLENYKSICQFV